MYNMDLTVCFIWVPAHVGADGNEVVDMLQWLKLQTDMRIALSGAEGRDICTSSFHKTLIFII